YRALGIHIAHEVFGEAARDAGTEGRVEMSDAAHRDVVRQLFAKLHRRWFPPPPKLEEHFLESVKGYRDVAKALRTDSKLAHLSAALYPEIEAAGEAQDAAELRAEVHAVGQMLQVMEDAWISVHLEG